VYLRLVWRAPAGSAADIFPLAVLDSILTGPSSLNMFGSGSISNKTSRLYQPLIEDQVAIAFNGSYNTTIDPYLYAITVIMHPAHQPEEAVALIDRQLDQIRSGKISLQEMEKAVKQARALFAYGTENITNQAYWLGYTEMFDKYAWFSEFVPSLKKVSVEDVARVAAQYLRPDQRVIGMYKPYLSKGGSA
jgi:zinc protease